MRHGNKVKHTRTETVRGDVIAGDARKIVVDSLRPSAGGWSVQATTTPSRVDVRLSVHGLENVKVREVLRIRDGEDGFTVTNVQFQAGESEVEVAFFGFTFADVLARFVAAVDLGAKGDE